MPNGLFSELSSNVVPQSAMIVDTALLSRKAQAAHFGQHKALFGRGSIKDSLQSRRSDQRLCLDVVLDRERHIELVLGEHYLELVRIDVLGASSRQEEPGQSVGCFPRQQAVLLKLEIDGVVL